MDSQSRRRGFAWGKSPSAIQSLFSALLLICFSMSISASDDPHASIYSEDEFPSASNITPSGHLPLMPTPASRPCSTNSSRRLTT